MELLQTGSDLLDINYTMMILLVACGFEITFA
jgi:hypothetical protein